MLLSEIPLDKLICRDLWFYIHMPHSLLREHNTKYRNSQIAPIKPSFVPKVR